MAAGPAPTATTAADVGTSSTGLGRALDLTARLATSWVGLLTAYAGAVLAAVVAFQKLKEPLSGIPLWARIVLVAALPTLALIFHTVPALAEQRRKNQLTLITGHLQTSYFQLAPREEEASFTRADGKHQEVLRWVRQSASPVLYLTGLSGSGKSSLLAAWVLPHLERENTVIIRLRGYQDPVAVLERELRLPGVVWQKAAPEAADLPSLLDRASRYLRPRRLLLVFDQFEEFVILQDSSRHERFNELMVVLRQRPIEGVSLLFVFRTDYIGVIEQLALPGLNQDRNWKEVPPFTESAARDFMRGSGLQVDDELLRDVLREAAEIEETKGLIRPVTINLCGLVLGRFATGLPRGYRPGQLIRGFLRESVLLPSIRDIAPRVVPQLISGYVTKRPRTVAELAKDTALDAAEVRGCLRVLGQSDRAIVRPLDAAQQTWEISHDFLVPLLDSIMARWSVSLWRKSRPWLPWVAAACMVATILIAASWGRDPILELEDLGWKVHKTDKALELEFEGPLRRQSLKPLERISQPIHMTLSRVGNLDIFNHDSADVADFAPLKNLTSLNLRDSGVTDLLGLVDMKNLTAITVDSGVDDVFPLIFLKKLTTIDLRNTGVRDVSPLTGLKNLTTLDLSNTQVIDISPLRELTNLTALNLDGTRVGDLSPLKELRNLTTLELSGTLVTRLVPVTDLTSLTRLDLTQTEVSDISPLKNLRRLTTLNLHGTWVTDVSPLRDLTSLTSLNLGNTRVSDISPLGDLTKVTTLDLSFTRLKDVSPLKDMTNLTALRLDGTAVSDLSPLRDLTSLTSLNLMDTKVSDVSPLKNLKNLTSLQLWNSNVTDVSPLKNLNHLQMYYGIR